MLKEGQSVIVGADPSADIVIDRQVVSGQHLRITRRSQGFHVEDLNSSNGTFVDGNRVQETLAHASSRIGLGSYETTLEALLGMSRSAPAAESTSPRKTPTLPNIRKQMGPPSPNPQRVHVGEVPIVIGREPDSDISIKDNAVSGRHARVFRNAGRIIIEDMGSRNGVHVWDADAQRWDEYKTYILHKGDVIRIGRKGEYDFCFERAPGLDVQQSGVHLVIRNLDVTVKNRDTGAPLNLLNDVSFAALPGEVIGIMGASGSGKTTLLNVLAGQSAPSSGDVEINGISIFSPEGTLKEGIGGLFGHAQQFDVVHPDLTVEEAVRFSAKLRSPTSWGNEDIEREVLRAITDVKLEKKKGTRVGSEEKKILSGGQRKRVTIAMELVNNPQILLMDEPTSGLSSHDTADLMRLVRSIANTGRTVVMTIHQPSYSAFLLMDQILILEEGGHVAYFGPTAKEAFEYFTVTDREPEALLERMERKPDASLPGKWAQNFAGHPLKKRMVDARLAALESETLPPPELHINRGMFSHISTLLQRSLTLKLRDITFFWALLVAAPFMVTLLFGLVLNTQVEDAWTVQSATVEYNYLVVLTIMVCFFGSLASAQEIRAEKKIFKHEKRGGVTVFSYMVSKALTYLLPALAFPAIALATLAFLTADDVIEGNMRVYWLCLVPAFFAAACCGLLISTVVHSEKGVIIWAVVYAIVQVVFSAFVPLHVTFKEKVDKDGEVRYVDAGNHEWLTVASNFSTAYWTLKTLVMSDDLCKSEDMLSDDLDCAGDLSDKSESEKQEQEKSCAQEIATYPDADDMEDADREERNKLMKKRGDLKKEFRIFTQTCHKKYYRDHGVKKANIPKERAPTDMPKTGLFMNLLLALSALGIAGLVLRRQSG